MYQKTIFLSFNRDSPWSKCDRVLALNVFGTLAVLMISVIGFLFGRPDFLDIALLYALLNFIGTIAILKFFRYKEIGDKKALSSNKAQ